MSQGADPLREAIGWERHYGAVRSQQSYEIGVAAGKKEMLDDVIRYLELAHGAERDGSDEQLAVFSVLDEMREWRKL